MELSGRKVCEVKDKKFFSVDLGFDFFCKGTLLLLSLLDYSRALMLSPDHERNDHHEIRLEK